MGNLKHFYWHNNDIELFIFDYFYLHKGDAQFKIYNNNKQLNRKNEIF